MPDTHHRFRKLTTARALAAWLLCGGAVHAGEGGAERPTAPLVDARPAWTGATPTDLPAFSPEILLGHVYYLASDELGGRGVGTPGIERAGQYIADQFAAAGIEPGGDDGTYFQTFQIGLDAELGEGTELALEGAGADQPAINTDYRPFAWSASGGFAGELLFVGYGLVDAARGYDDYRGVDAQGRVLLMLRREPPSWSIGGEYSGAARFDNKAALAKELGAVAVLVANQTPDDGEPDRLMPFFGRAAAQDYGIPAFHITRHLADTLLAAGGLDSLDVVQERLDADQPTHCSAVVPGVRVRGSVDLQREQAPSRNVIGLIRGTGPQADEYVVVGAHYDHLGLRAVRSFFGPTGDGKEEIHNGADDNASGTAGLIELGRALARAGDLNRSLLLIAFTGEELGLLGSAHFVDHPTVPLDRIAAMVNLDMIGRMPDDRQRVSVYGVGTGAGLEDLVHNCASIVGLEVDAQAPVSEQSDEASFYERGIPTVFFFTGLHVDYHQPTDDASKLNEQGAARVARMAYGVVRGLVDSPGQPTYCYVPGRASPSAGPARAVMGFWPKPAAEGESADVVVARVAPNSPADRAGIRPGDRIVQLDGWPVQDAADYAEAIGGKRPGESVEVVLERDGQRITLTVTFAAG